MTRDLAAELAFLPEATAVARYDEPKQGLMEILARVRTDATAASDLVEAARARPDAFDDEMLAYIIRGSRVHAISAPMCVALEAIVRHRGSVPSVLEAELMDILEDGQLDDAARLATTCAEVGSAHRDAVMSRLVRYIYARDSFISFEPRSEWLTPLLHRLADLNAQGLADLLAVRLRDDDASARHGAATFAGELCIAHHEVATRLRPAVLASLERESFLFESGTTAAIDALAAMYIEDPGGTDAAITTARGGAREHARTRALRVYDRALYFGTPHPSMREYLDRKRQGIADVPLFVPDDLAAHIVDRLLSLMESEPTIETWDPVADALEYAGVVSSTRVLQARLDRLIFALLEAARLRNMPRQRIAVPGVPPKPEQLVALEKMAADTQWSGVFTGIASAIAGAARDGDEAVVSGVITTIERLKPIAGDGWIRGELVKVLRVLLPTPAGRARVVPLLYTYLFDSAVPVQIAALTLCESLVERHQDELPQLLLDTVSALVLSTYVYVGRAAVRVAGAIRPRTPEFRTELVANLLIRSKAEGTDWEPRLKAIVAAVRVADDDVDLAGRIVVTYGIPFFTEAPSLYARREVHWFRRWDPPLSYQLAYAICVIRHLERPTKPGDQPSVGDADEEIAELRRVDRVLLGRLADQIAALAEAVAAIDPGLAFDLTAVLTDAGRPDLAAAVCTLIVTKKRDDRQSEFYARLANAAHAYYEAEVALAGGDVPRATTLFATSVRGFEAIGEY